MISGAKKESGSVVTEASIVLPLFLVSVMLIINIVNILCVHNKVQFAINSTAHEIASYSYIMSATGLVNAVRTIEADGDPYTEKIDETSTKIFECVQSIKTLAGDTKDLGSDIEKLELSEESIQNLRNQREKVGNDVHDSVDKTQAAGESVIDRVKNVTGTAIGAAYIGVEAALYLADTKVTEWVVPKIAKKYMMPTSEETDAYLKHYGVKDGYAGLSFAGSSILNDKGKKMIDIVVTYDIDLTTFGLVLEEKQPKLSVVQRVTIPAWLDGDQNTPESPKKK